MELCYSDTFNTFNDFNENFDLSLYYNPFNDDINFLPDSESPFNSNFNDIEPFNDIPDSDIPNSDVPDSDIPDSDVSDSFNYQYSLTVGDCFDDWLSVDTFMYQYCLERGFGYQIFRSDKDPNDPAIIRRKSFRCSSSGVQSSKSG